MRALPLCLLAIFLLSSCTQQDNSKEEQQEQAYYQRLIPPDEDAVARRVIELIRTGDIAQAQKMAGPPLQTANARYVFSVLHDTINQGQILDVKPIGFLGKRKSDSDGQTFFFDVLTYQLHFQGRWYVALISVENSPPNAVLGIHITYFNGFESPAAFNSFSFVGRGWRDYAAFLLCILTPIFILVITVVCARAPVRRKWFWIPFILLGIVQFKYNWTYGTVDVHPLAILLLGSGYTRADIYSPLILEWAIPVGAFGFLLFRRQLIEDEIRRKQKPAKKRSRAARSP